MTTEPTPKVVAALLAVRAGLECGGDLTDVLAVASVRGEPASAEIAALLARAEAAALAFSKGASSAPKDSPHRQVAAAVDDVLARLGYDRHYPPRDQAPAAPADPRDQHRTGGPTMTRATLAVPILVALGSIAALVLLVAGVLNPGATAQAQQPGQPPVPPTIGLLLNHEDTPAAALGGDWMPTYRRSGVWVSAPNAAQSSSLLGGLSVACGGPPVAIDGGIARCASDRWPRAESWLRARGYGPAAGYRSRSGACDYRPARDRAGGVYRCRARRAGRPVSVGFGGGGRPVVRALDRREVSGL